MKTKYKEWEGVPPEFCKDPGKIKSLTAAGITTPTQLQPLLKAGRVGKYNAKTQPRTNNGRFRKILARLKSNLGEDELQEIAGQIQEAERAEIAGDYGKASEAAKNVISLVDHIEEGAIDPDKVQNLRKGSADLGRVLAYLPLPQGQAAEKVRFSDLPPSTASFIDDMIGRVEKQINKQDAAKFTKVLRSFISGVRTMSSDELSAELAKLLRLLS